MGDAASALADAGRAALRRVLPPSWFLKRIYLRKTGAPLDLRNPRDFSAKLQWLKLYGHTPLHTVCADKIAVRAHVAAQGLGHLLVPALLETHDPGDLRPERVRANRFVAKTNHDSGGVIVCRDAAAFDWEAARRSLAARMRRNFYYVNFEPQYRDIRPGVLVERLLGDGRGDLPDYKLFCFNGRVGLIQIDADRSVRHRQAFFDRDWRRMPVRRFHPQIEGDPPAPAGLATMIDAAETLAAPFRFCRVDFYDVEGRVWFGEITFHPSSGYFRFQPPEWERRIGDMLDLTAPPSQAEPGAPSAMSSNRRA